MKVQVILGSTRPGRVTEKVTKWVANSAAASGKAEIEIVDLADYSLSFLEEPISPQYNPDRKPAPETVKWLDKLAEADAYIFVSPEYNRALPAVLKNALDHVAFEMSDKPVTAVTHGSTGGAQAYATLKMILPALNAIVMPKNVYVQYGNLADISDDGELSAELKANPWGPQGPLDAALEQIFSYAEALKPLRG
ncbi:MAG: putative reductase [Candidatus Saccharibacteria bacterium]|nr:putative reductase [Candidatus Saccharibacteria bacterium]